MKIKNVFIVSILSALLGILVCGYFNSWIIIRLPTINTTCTTQEQINGSEKKAGTLFYWHNNSWKTERTDLIWTERPVTNCTYLLNSWFTFLDEERIIDRKVSVQTAIISASGKEIYLSFDRSPFNPHNTTFEKWMLIEGVLKTLRENKITIPLIHFLEHHQPLRDNHLDFTNPWPIEGFIKN